MLTIKHTICPSCSVGCGLNIISKENEVVGTFPYKRHPINEGKNCLNGRNSIELFNDRIKKPSLVKNKELVDSDNDTIIGMVKDELSSIDSNELGIICSGKMTNEEIECVKSFAESFGTENIGFYGNNFYNVDVESIDYDDISSAKLILEIGDIIKENPLIGRRVIIAKENGSSIISVDTVEKSITTLNSDEYIKVDSITDFVNNISIKDKLSEEAIILVNKLDEKEDLEKLEEVASETGAKLLPVLCEANSKGALEKINSLNKDEILDIIKKSKVLLVINANPLDYLSKNDISSGFIVNISNFNNEFSTLSDVVLPGKTWTEKSGSFTNSCGLTQEFVPSVEIEDENLSEIEIFEKLA